MLVVPIAVLQHWLLPGFLWSGGALFGAMFLSAYRRGICGQHMQLLDGTTSGYRLDDEGLFAVLGIQGHGCSTGVPFSLGQS